MAKKIPAGKMGQILEGAVRLCPYYDVHDGIEGFWFFDLDDKFAVSINKNNWDRRISFDEGAEDFGIPAGHIAIFWETQLLLFAGPEGAYPNPSYEEEDEQFQLVEACNGLIWRTVLKLEGESRAEKEV